MLRGGPADCNACHVVIFNYFEVGDVFRTLVIIRCCRLDVSDESVLVIERVFCGVEGSDRAPGVVAAAPAPVEVEVVVLVVTVAHESVTASAVVVGTAVIQWHSFVEAAVFQHLCPLLDSVEIKSPETQSYIVVGSVVKIGAQSYRHGKRIGPAAVAAVLHVDGNTAMMQELGDVEVIFFGAQRIEVVRHELEMVFSLAEVGCLRWVTFWIIGIGAGSLCRPVPEFHHLTHRCGDAACINTTSTSFLVFRTLAVVRPILVPCGLAEWPDYGAVLATLFDPSCLGNRFPLGFDIVGSCDVMLPNILNLFAEAVERELKAVGDVVRVEASCC